MLDAVHAPIELTTLVDQVNDAAQRGAVLRVRGHGSKDFLGNASRGEVLDTRAWQGIEQYEPSELVIKARAGTPLSDIEAVLAERGQHLAFEPPRWAFQPGAQGMGPTIGGVVASGFSGPGRVSRGAVRDHVLGAGVLNGRGEVLRFGGSVMKNVAGFDLSRLMTGSMGTLGLILDVTLKVMPQPVATATIRMDMAETEALAQVNRWAAQPLPLDASAWWDDLLVLRLRGARAAVESAVLRLCQERQGELIAQPSAEPFWQGLRDHSDEFFQRAREAVIQSGRNGVTLWRVSVPPTAAPLGLPGEQLTEWFGAQRWVCTSAPATVVFEAAARAGGHAQPFVSQQVQPLVHEAALSPVLRQLHQRVQQSFDPHGVFNTGRLHANPAVS
ncbi:MAG: glycolate oxidase subunit GlcE [Aquabacterium sp.]|uniref:glycolate oxidase subunit GlcE n=1 Tax=Aquabacterium sp. TaxID=1872578 RepID=UPI00271C17C9|nr:glycolate oxidase subunit GlcE [Aquabacterium sp.]MDO9003511.1 glycolate oxidase subunit GlcE [Aquabacterium sp.]